MTSLVRIVAVLVLGLLALDIGDAWCDPLVDPGGELLTSTSGASATDPCSGTCVPDCFCCSSSVPAASLHLVCEPLPTALAFQVTEAGASSGFEFPLDHVPLVS
jgi:hypothetical protein